MKSKFEFLLNNCLEIKPSKKKSDSVTYIKPETTQDRSPNSVREILHFGLAAAKQQDWLSVIDYLKSLPQTKSRNNAKRFILREEEERVGCSLAIEMLLEADFQHKWAISKVIPSFGSSVIPSLITLLQDEAIEADVRWFVCQILGKFKDERVILSLVELLERTEDRELIEVAGQTLIEIGNDAIAVLEDLLTHPEHRTLAVHSLFYIHTPQTIAPLLTVTDDRDPQLRAIAIKALGSFHDSRIPPVLVAALEDKASQVRSRAAIALGFRPDICGEFDLVNRLKALLFDFNLEVCGQSAVSLSRMKCESATKALFEVLQLETTPISLKLNLVKALGWSETSSAIDYLGQTLAKSTTPISQEIITILGRTSVPQLKPQAAKVLVYFWQNQPQLSPDLRQSLATSLGELRCESGRIVLEQLTLDSDRRVKLHAISALKKIST